MLRKKERDLEKKYSKSQFVAKLRRFADAIEHDQPFAIQVGGERIRVPAGAEFTIEHERSRKDEEVEFQVKWALEPMPKRRAVKKK